MQSKLAELITSPVEVLTIDIGNGVTLDGWMLKPPAFDASRTYPVIVFVYGEPAGQTVTNSWRGAQGLFNRALANAGYVVVSFDNRGTPAPKGAAWRKVVYGSVGDLSSKEQAAAIRALAARQPFIDLSRIGIWGWSGGGTNTLNAMFRFPDVYKVGVAVAPVPDQRLYDTIYRTIHGTAGDNAAGYGRISHQSGGTQGRLLIVHGSGDDNVLPGTPGQSVVELAALRPDGLSQSHPRDPEGPASAHVYQLIARYFVEHLPLQGRAPLRCTEEIGSAWLRPQIPIRCLDGRAEMSRRVPGPARVVKAGARQRDEVRVPGADNRFGLIEIRDEPDRDHRQAGRRFDGAREGHLVTRPQRDLLCGCQTAARHVKSAAAVRLQRLRERNRLVDVPPSRRPVRS